VETLQGVRASTHGISVLKMPVCLYFKRRALPSEEASGFALAYDVLFIVVINRKDAPVRCLFSLAHEFAHLALRKSGVSDLDIDAMRFR